MEISNNLVVLNEKSTKQFYCEICQYKTDNKSNWNKHLMTRKHKFKHIEQNEQNVLLTQCIFCKKIFKSRSGLWYHEKKCKNANDKLKSTKQEISNEECIEIINNSKINCYDKNEIIEKDNDNEKDDYKELIKTLIKQNNDIQQAMLKQQEQYGKQMSEILPKVGNNTYNTTNKVNMNIFLNEHCKDAYNLMDFVQSLKLQLKDLENTGKYGFVEGMTDIFVRALREMEITKRPIHCTDLKREILYVKENNEWEKEDSTKKNIVKAIDYVRDHNLIQLQQWAKLNPECRDYNHSKSDDYRALISNCIGGIDKEQDNNVNKVIKNVAKEVYIDKTKIVKS